MKIHRLRVSLFSRVAAAQLLLCAVCLAWPLSAQTGRSQLSKMEPGALYLEDILPRPVRLTVAQPAQIYYQMDMQRVLGNMIPGTTVQLIAMSDHAYKVRGRASHGDVSGWMRMEALTSTVPDLNKKLTDFYTRQQEVDALIAANEVALGMTVNEVTASLGRPSRKKSRVSQNGRAESLEYSIYQNVPQTVTGRDRYGNLVQNVIYVKMEVGRLTVHFEDNIVTEIEETLGNPLGRGGVKLVPAPIIVY